VRHAGAHSIEGTVALCATATEEFCKKCDNFESGLDRIGKRNQMKTIKSIAIIFSCLLVVFIELPKSYGQTTVGIEVSIRNSPPSLPVYDQPPCPVDGYLWTPGYWAYYDNDYYWVPGVGVSPPRLGYLWTPGYWNFSGGSYRFNDGYWASDIGYYGGVNYGYGYGGSGYYGGRWEGERFRYNTAVVNVNTTVINNTYVDRTVIVNNTTVNHSSFNGPGGVTSTPTTNEKATMQKTHTSATLEQTSHRQDARKDRSQFASVNNGRPATVAMERVKGQRNDPQQKSATIATSKPVSRPAGVVVNKTAIKPNSGVVNKSPAQSIAKPQTAQKAPSQTAPRTLAPQKAQSQSAPKSQTPQKVQTQHVARPQAPQKVQSQTAPKPQAPQKVQSQPAPRPQEPQKVQPQPAPVPQAPPKTQEQEVPQK